MAKGTSYNLWGLVISASLVVVAPAVGFVTTTLMVRGAFNETSTVEPSEKARTLAEGISTSMNAAAIGSGIGFLALVGTAFFAWRVYRESKQGADK